MKPFLYQVASHFYSEYGAEVSRLAFVFPNRRTGLFFQKYLSEVSEKPLFSPTILTINDLFVQLSGKQTADRISMLFKLYDIYLSHSGSSETFDEFLYWGEMLLNDFDDIDKYMADRKEIRPTRNSSWQSGRSYTLYIPICGKRLQPKARDMRV